MKYLICLALLGIGVCQATEPETTQSEPVETLVIEWIEALESPSFAMREKATRELWGLGRAAEPALRNAIRKENLEVRERAGQVLADFDYGITPDVAPHVIKLLRQFRESTPAQRMLILSSLIESGDADLLARMIQRTDDVRTRSSIFDQSIASTEIMAPLVESNRVTWWLESVGRGFDAKKPYEVIANWLTTEGVIRQLEQRQKLDLIDLTIEQQSSDEDRYRFLRRLFVQREFVDFFSSPDQLGRLFAYVDVVQTAPERHELIVRFVSLTREPTHYDVPVFDKLQRWVIERGTQKSLEEFDRYVLDANLERPEIMTMLSDARRDALLDHLQPERRERFHQALKKRGLVTP